MAWGCGWSQSQGRGHWVPHSLPGHKSNPALPPSIPGIKPAEPRSAPSHSAGKELYPGRVGTVGNMSSMSTKSLFLEKVHSPWGFWEKFL